MRTDFFLEGCGQGQHKQVPLWEAAAAGGDNSGGTATASTQQPCGPTRHWRSLLACRTGVQGEGRTYKQASEEAAGLGLALGFSRLGAIAVLALCHQALLSRAGGLRVLRAPLSVDDHSCLAARLIQKCVSERWRSSDAQGECRPVRFRVPLPAPVARLERGLWSDCAVTDKL